jgi:group I intron endonuclease
MMNKVNRKRRSDRRHIVYQITNTANSNTYIGVTAGFRLKDLRVRINKHVQRALTENKDWTLCQEIRKYGPEFFEYEILEIIKGKTEAHKRERELIGVLCPKLNSQ